MVVDYIDIAERIMPHVGMRIGSGVVDEKDSSKCTPKPIAEPIRAGVIARKIFYKVIVQAIGTIRSRIVGVAKATILREYHPAAVIDRHIGTEDGIADP